MTLLFKPKHVPMILSGTKTQTRRLWKRPRVKVGGTYWASTKLFDQNARFARLRVVRLWREPLGAISEADARAEGYLSPEDYLFAFDSINGHVPTDTVVDCVEFEVVDRGPYP